MRKARSSRPDGALAQALAYSLGKAADVLVQNPIATGMSALALNYAFYKAGFWDPRAEEEPGHYDTVTVEHPAETTVDPDHHLIGSWLWVRGTTPSYPELWRWNANANIPDYCGGTGAWVWYGTSADRVGQTEPQY